MNNPIYRRIRNELRRRRLSETDLQDYLNRNGAEFPLMMVDTWADNDDLRMIAWFLGISPSELIGLKGDHRATAMAILDEIWDGYESILSITKHQAWEAISSSSEFRGSHPSSIRAEVELILDGLLPSQNYSRVCVNFLDCPERCVTRCKLTGRKPGA